MEIMFIENSGGNSINSIGRKKLYSMLSLCKRAGMLVSGEANSENAIKSNKAKMILLSRDASDNTVKKFCNKAAYYKVCAYTLELSKEQLGNLIGETQRSVVVITEEGFAKQLDALIQAF